MTTEPESENKPQARWGQLSALFMSRFMIPFWLIVIVLIGGGLRFTGVDWDDGHHLHPDERFLTIVVNDIKWPESDFISSYFDEAT